MGEPPPEAVTRDQSGPSSSVPVTRGSDILYSNSTLSGTPSGMSLLVTMVPRDDKSVSIQQQRSVKLTDRPAAGAKVDATIISNGHEVTVEEGSDEEDVMHPPPIGRSRRRSSSLPTIPENGDIARRNEQKTRRSEGSTGKMDDPVSAAQSREEQAQLAEATAQSLATLEQLSAPVGSPSGSHCSSPWNDNMRHAAEDALERERRITENPEQYSRQTDTLRRLQRLHEEESGAILASHLQQLEYSNDVIDTSHRRIHNRDTCHSRASSVRSGNSTSRRRRMAEQSLLRSISEAEDEAASLTRQATEARAEIQWLRGLVDQYTTSTSVQSDNSVDSILWRYAVTGNHPGDESDNTDSTLAPPRSPPHRWEARPADRTSANGESQTRGSYIPEPVVLPGIHCESVIPDRITHTLQDRIVLQRLRNQDMVTLGQSNFDDQGIKWDAQGHPFAAR
ncbi:hypothetical protein DFH07DRAFT_764225 [Mycena maculata]|uniref:Uncharacterized protein n=1 Tax=Mycena maculata TaxID=230809 RepID=A0AAD7P0X0_9AGAR|nr:hypothetical protein DFH07DRAFT_764225 [Mycena maculata]